MRAKQQREGVVHVVGCDRIRHGWFMSRQVFRGVNAVAVVLGLGLSSLLTLADHAKAGAPNFAAHRAVYDMSLHHAATGSGIADLSGRMVYELSGNACVGFTQNMRFVTKTRDRDGQQQMNDLRTSSWEDGAGERLRFSLSQYQEDKLAEAIEGDATRLAPDGSRGSVNLRSRGQQTDQASKTQPTPSAATGAKTTAKAPVTVQLTKPSPKQLALGPGVVFPIQHSQTVLKAALAGQRSVSSRLYDGSEKGERIYYTSAFIGAPVAKSGLAKIDAGIVDRLAPTTAWPISIGYFNDELGKVDAVPEYELSFIYFENGVAARLLIDYGDFSIRGKLRKLELLAEADCRQTQ